MRSRLSPFFAVPALLLSFCTFNVGAAPELFDPPALYLQWQRDPTTTMTVHWHTTNEAPSVVQCRPVAGRDWITASGASVPMPESRTPRFIHIAEFTGLTPDTTYVFRFNEQSKEFRFRTMPRDLSRPIRFIQGGDVYHQREWMDQMNALAAKYDPAFVVFGGDLAYSNDRTNQLERVQRWYDYFDSWKKNAVAPDGRLIPMLVTIGNHEVKGFWGKSPEDAPCFYALFAMPGRQGYNGLDFGNYLSLLLLDSGLSREVTGAQTRWIGDWLSRRRKMPHIFPVYHVPAYPSVRPDEGGENGRITAEVRDHWVPLFERYGVKVAFEHHDHAYKRTHPIRRGKVDPTGIVFLGDGAWGVNLRKTHPIDEKWYLAKAGAIRHFFIVTLYPDQRHITAVDVEGRIFDELYQRVRK